MLHPAVLNSRGMKITFALAEMESRMRVTEIDSQRSAEKSALCDGLSGLGRCFQKDVSDTTVIDECG